MKLIGLYAGSYILKHKDERGFKLGRSRQTAKSAYNAIMKKYKVVKPGSKYHHVGGGIWRIYSIANDRKRTGKTTTDKRKWAKRPHKLDFKGVDTKGSKVAGASRKTKVVKRLGGIGYLKTIGNEWKAGDKHRIYINKLEELYGFDANYYGTGNISSATLDGEQISNSKARKIKTNLDFGKLWYDVNAKRFYSDRLPDSYVEKIVKRIKSKM